MHGPDPNDKHPMAGFPQVCFIRNTVSNPAIEIGQYTYYDDPDDPEGFERNVLYHYPFMGDKLRIGKFCAIARGVKFVMNGAHHKMSGFSTYPFQIFGHGWEEAMPAPEEFPYKGDTVVGHDVWLGYEALVMPGVRIGNGAIVATRAVVASDVPPYAIVGGNPARVLKHRFAPAPARKHGSGPRCAARCRRRGGRRRVTWQRSGSLGSGLPRGAAVPPLLEEVVRHGIGGRFDECIDRRNDEAPGERPAHGHRHEQVEDTEQARLEDRRAAAVRPRRKLLLQLVDDHRVHHRLHEGQQGAEHEGAGQQPADHRGQCQVDHCEAQCLGDGGVAAEAHV